MSDELYRRLCERLNQNIVKRPRLPSVLSFLRELFTEEQAGIAADMPLGAHTVRSLARHLNRNETELEAILETMADEGTLFVARNESGEREYSLPPFAPGLLELQYLRGEDTEMARRRHALVAQMNEDLDARMEELYRNVDAANERIGVPALRTLAVEEELPGSGAAATWERISGILRRENSFAVGTCYCRQDARFQGNPCRIDGVPMDACVYFGAIADYIVDRNFGKRYSREELTDLLKACEGKGLIHNINNFLGDNIVLCNCCGCCCHVLKPMIRHRGLRMVAGSNFVASVNRETCTGCEICAEICQVGAIDVDGDRAVVNVAYCLGCGVCVSHCPSESLTLVRCADDVPPKKSDRIVGFGV